MNKYAFGLFLFLFLESNSNSSGVESRNETTENSICGITFNTGIGLHVVKKHLSDSFLTSRVNQERYDACPYDVGIIVENKRTMRIDFANSPNYQSIIESRKNGDPINFSGWRFQDDTWSLDQEIFDASSDASPLVHESEKGVIVSAYATRKPTTKKASSKPDDCFNILFVGTDLWAAGMLCGVSDVERKAVLKLMDSSFYDLSTN